MDASAGTDKTGSIFAISDVQSTDAGARSTYRAGASFRRILMADTRITSRTIGPCLLETFGAGTQAREEPRSAGTIQINGGAVSAHHDPHTLPHRPKLVQS
jgi:hypothetical protein